MNTLALMAMMMATTGGPGRSGHAPVSPHRVVVCTNNQPGADAGTARALARHMFAEIGIDVEWRLSTHCAPGGLQVTLSDPSPEDLRPGALAYALPFEGTHIVVFLDRVYAQSHGYPAHVLAHVLAHEITHFLQGLARHSTGGLMKARWSTADFQEMCRKGLPFAAEDIALIYDGMAQQGGTVVSASELLRRNGSPDSAYTGSQSLAATRRIDK